MTKFGDFDTWIGITTDTVRLHNVSAIAAKVSLTPPESSYSHPILHNIAWIYHGIGTTINWPYRPAYFGPVLSCDLTCEK